MTTVQSTDIRMNTATKTTTTEHLSERVRRVAETIYKATKPDPNNWIHHTHDAHDVVDLCEICKSLNLSQADWDGAYGIE